MAFHQGRWGRWLGWLLPASYLRGDLPSWILAALAAGLWLWFCLRLGRDTVLQAAAFGLGVASIYVTHAHIHLEEVLPWLEPTGELVGDALYFIVGVGLPLLLVLRRRRGEGDGLALGALVGLGFAAVENVSYFAGGGLGAALSRFMTANFLHMALTAIAAEAVTRAVRGAPEAGPRAVNTFVVVVLLHGVYDLFLSSPQLAEASFLAMTTLVVTGQQFLRAAPVGRGRDGMPLLRVVVLALVALAGASFVYGSVMAGPAAAAAAVLEGLLGVILLIFVFERELG